MFRDWTSVDSDELYHLRAIAIAAREYSEGSGDPKSLFHAVEDYELYLTNTGKEYPR